ncbi:G-protein coupled receptor 35-like [Pezoporus occidentalis]|uniref:G-protein coupled receptor 35-like n=1 Tax=Pezoporus occidentalis TaxID=407982 RepID=UPI002F90C0FA
MENCTEDDDMRNSIALFQLIVYIPVLSLGIPPNMIAFWLFCCKLKRWTETRVYVINLIVADSCMLFALPFLIFLRRHILLGPHSAFLKRAKETRHKLGLNLKIIHCLRRFVSVVTLVAVSKHTAINHPWKAKGLGSLLARSPLWCAVNAHDRQHLRVQARGGQQGRHLLLSQTAQRAFKNAPSCRIPFWASASHWLQ